MYLNLEGLPKFSLPSAATNLPRGATLEISRKRERGESDAITNAAQKRRHGWMHRGVHREEGVVKIDNPLDLFKRFDSERQKKLDVRALKLSARNERRLKNSCPNRETKTTCRPGIHPSKSGENAEPAKPVTLVASKECLGESVQDGAGRSDQKKQSRALLPTHEMEALVAKSIHHEDSPTGNNSLGRTTFRSSPLDERTDDRGRGKKGCKPRSETRDIDSIRLMLRRGIPSLKSEVTANLSAEKTFCELGIHPLLTPFPSPTAIQAQAIPHLLDANVNSALIQSDTGSGKTLAYVLPIVQKLLFTTEIVPQGTEDFRGLGTLALILAPTRELAAQIHGVFSRVLDIRKWGSTDTPHVKRHWLVAGLLVGSSPSTNAHGELPQYEADGSSVARRREKAMLRKGVHILVCTPGRLLDHLQATSSFETGNLHTLVLDEADHLIDLGMKNVFQRALTILRERARQPPRIILTSATIRSNVRLLMKSALSPKDSLLIDSETAIPVGNWRDVKPCQIPVHLQQYKLTIRLKLRLVSLLRVLHGLQSKCMVFFASCESVEFLHSLLLLLKTKGFFEGLNLFMMHGKMSEALRMDTYKNFRDTDGPSSVMLCTDVAARGLDLRSDVGIIIQYDPPQAMEDYVHRCGRTARAGNAGLSLLFEPVPSSVDTSGMKEYQLQDEDLSLFARAGIESLMNESPSLKVLALRAFRAWVQSVSRLPGMMKTLHLGHAAASFGIGEKPKDVLDPEICHRVTQALTQGKEVQFPKWHERGGRPR